MRNFGQNSQLFYFLRLTTEILVVQSSHFLLNLNLSVQDFGAKKGSEANFTAL